MPVNDLLIDAELAINFASTHNIALPGNTIAVLQAARANPASIAMPGSNQETDFLAALSIAIVATGRLVEDLRACETRKSRVVRLAADAKTLLDFAASNGRKVDSTVRSSIVTVQNAAYSGALTVAQEDELLAAYESLAASLAPITCETLNASPTMLPTWAQFRSGAGWTHFSIGRFFNVIVFIVVLVGTGITLSYYPQGAYALKRVKDLPDQLAKLEQDATEKRLLYSSREKARDDEAKKPAGADPQALDAAEKALAGAQEAYISATASRDAALVEFQALPARLARWSASPCSDDADWLFKFFLCSDLDKPAKVNTTTPSKSASIEVRPQTAASAPSDSAAAAENATLTQAYLGVEAARTVANRLNDVYLPLLLGWLGAHAYILRRMSKEISDRTFAPGSSFGHIVRSGLGALAGLASVWLLSAQAVGGAQWANLPVWALAFVAGYGIELVFAFMDRIINAFTSQK